MLFDWFLEAGENAGKLLGKVIPLSSAELVITEKIVDSIISILMLMLIGRLVYFVIYWRVDNNVSRYLARKTTNYIVGFIGLLLIWKIWIGTKDMALYLGFITAGLAVALKDLLVNLTAWIFIVIRKPFTVGDRISIGTTSGDVIDIRLFLFSLSEIGNWVDADQSTGRIVHVPNGFLFQKEMFNYNQGFNFIWNEIPVVFTFESKWEDAKKMLLEIGTKHTPIKSEYAAKEMRNAAKKFMIQFNDLTPVVWTDTTASGIRLTIRYLCNPRERRSSETKIWEDLLREVDQRDDIDFAYPTQRFYNNVTEGKPGARAEPN